MRINVNDFDDQLFNQVAEIASKRGCRKTTAPQLIHFVFSEYMSLCQMAEIDNPIMLRKMQIIMESVVEESERRIGGRLMKLLSDNTINLSVLTQSFHDSMNQYDDPAEAQMKLDRYRARAVEHLRESKSPLTYVQLLKEPADE